MSDFILTNLTLSAPDRGTYLVPDFFVSAPDIDTAVSIATRIVLCDRRTSDGVFWLFAGSLGDRRGVIRNKFRIQMTDGGLKREYQVYQPRP